MQKVQVVDESSGETTRAHHVIGVDESGDMTDSKPFALAVVRCPREDGERLAELLVNHQLPPWQGKSKTIAKNRSPEERNRRVQSLIESFADEPITWRVAFGYSIGGIDHKAAGICNLSKKTITSVTNYQGDSIIVPDGELDMYGNKQKYLRIQAAQAFDGSFQSTFGGIYVTGLSKADRTYPEVATADYLAGYVRSAIKNGQSVEALPDQVIWFNRDWREPTTSPSPCYQICGVGGEYGEIEQTRVTAWIKGRNPEDDSPDVSSQWKNTIQRLKSGELRKYLLETMSS